MQHLRQEDLIKLAASELEGAEGEVVEQHLSTCSACRSRYREQAAVWEALGEWGWEAASPNLLAGVRRKLAEVPVMRHQFWTDLGRISRIAAAIVIGVTVGYGAGRTVPPTKPSRPPITSAAAEEAAAEALGVAYFEGLSPAGFYAALQDLAHETSPGGEQS